jgi:hypothetical protein
VASRDIASDSEDDDPPPSPDDEPSNIRLPPIAANPERSRHVSPPKEFQEPIVSTSEARGLTRTTYLKYYRGAAQSFPSREGYSRIDHFNDPLSPTERRRNPFHPFSTEDEWEFMSTLDMMDLSNDRTDSILETRSVSHISLGNLIRLV